MKKILAFIAFAGITVSCFSQQKKLVDYVDPFIGTGGHGHTYPGPMLPFGMVQLSPDNGTQGWDWCSGYHYSDSVITGFSHTHLSGTGIGDLADISVMPSVGKRPDTIGTPSRFSHKQEKASPGYYQVLLQDYNVKTELTTSLRCGMHRYTFPKASDAMIRLDLGFAINWDKPVDCMVRKINDSTYTGYRKSAGWAKDQWVFFAIRLSKPVKNLVLFADNKIVRKTEAAGKKAIACFVFETKEKEEVMMKVGLSFASIEGAVASLDEIRGWDFEKVRKIAEDTWEEELSKIKINTTDEKTKKIFYTAFYHTCQAPLLYSDANGNYKNAISEVVNTTSPVYSVHSIWDTFRAENPLFTLVQPKLVPAIIQSYLAFYRQSGLLPVWDLHYNETNCMTGYHAVPVVADAILKGFKGFDYEEAFTAMKASAMQNIRATDHYRHYGFVPQDKQGYSVTITMEYAFDDWCIAKVAKKLGHMEDYTTFTKRAANYANLFDNKSGFFRAKNSDGKFVEPFDPYYSEHDETGMYIEGTAWQHTFFVPHAVDEYANLLGGKAQLEEKLDSLFTTTSQMHGDHVSNDISGLIGQYAHGNEPSHHIAYMYATLGAPQKTAQRVSQILETLYHADPNGLSGNEDCGQMSAWYVWSALGFYPMNPASGQYVFGSPVIEDAVIDLPGNKKIKIQVKGANTGGFVKKVTLNGKEHSNIYISHAEIMNGGLLEIEMGKN
ncbi:MAG: GH92 family glycosyl hydrolase [Bacteroidota bacterium]